MQNASNFLTTTHHNIMHLMNFYVRIDMNMTFISTETTYTPKAFLSYSIRILVGNSKSGKGNPSLRIYQFHYGVNGGNKGVDTSVTKACTNTGVCKQ